MKKLSICTCCIVQLLVSISAFAQPYRSLFGNENTEWTVMAIKIYHGPIVGGSVNWEDIKLTYEKDTVVQAKVYKKIAVGNVYTQAYTNLFKSFLVREDTAAGKVWYNEYAINSCGHYDTTEQLMFDFNLHVGDTFNLESPICLPVTTFGKTVDSVYYDSDNLKHIRFQSGQVTSQMGTIVEFIEGSGSTLGIFYKANCDYAGWPYTLCQWKDGIKTYSNTVYSGDCDPKNNLQLSISTTLKNKLAAIYPNPARNELIIDVQSVSPCQLSIIDMSGKEVYAQQIAHKHIILVDSWARGLYFATITDNKGQKHVEKIVLN